jgi:urease accessory protein
MHEAKRTALPNPTNAGWTARLDLEFAQRDAQTYLAHRRHMGPLVVQRPFFPEPAVCHVYVVHPPGGVVGGDDLTIDIRVKPGAHALLTTPAATKFYRCDRRMAQQHQALTIEEGVLEWLPQETIFYPGALARSATIVKLSRSSRFIGWELPCLGLPARGESFDRGQLQLNTELWVDDCPRVIDRLRIEGEGPARTAAWGLAGFDALGTLLAYPADRTLLEQVRALAYVNVEFAATLVDEVLVCRGLAAQAEHVKRAFSAIWHTLRPSLLGRAAHAPRIWAT